MMVLRTQEAALMRFIGAAVMVQLLDEVLLVFLVLQSRTWIKDQTG